MTSADYDLRFIVAGADQLENYLLSNEIYKAPGIRAPAGENPYPQFTLGWLLLAQIRAQARAQTSSQHTEIAQLQLEIEKIRTKWRAAWSRKALAEFKARLKLWRDFLSDYRVNPEGNVDRYAYEVNRRVLLELLRPETDEVPEAESDALSGLDRMLKAVFVEGEFIWDENLQTSFPRQTYWYLWGTPKTNLTQIG